MGVNLTELVKGEETEISELKGRKIAIDAYNTIYQFLSIIRDRFTGEPLKDSRGRVTSHLSGLLYRTARMMEAGIQPVYVFDGKPPGFKKETSEARRAVREEAEKKWKEAVKRKDMEAVRRYSQQASKLTDDMIEESRRLLSCMGVPNVVAPSEGEAQAAYFVRKGMVWSAGSQDWDSLLFGTPRLVKNLTITGRRKIPRKEKYIEIKPEIIELDRVLKALEISHDQLIVLGILVGTDYNPGGIKGIGPKTALKIVKEQKNPEAVLGSVDWDFDTPAEKIFDFFKNPPVQEMEIPRERLDPDRLMEMMVEEHDFSSERMEAVIKRLEEAKKDDAQSDLGRFFGR